VRIPDFRLVDRIKTKTVMDGIKYFGIIGLRIVKQKISNSDNITDARHNDANDEKNRSFPFIIH